MPTRYKKLHTSINYELDYIFAQQNIAVSSYFDSVNVHLIILLEVQWEKYNVNQPDVKPSLIQLKKRRQSTSTLNHLQ